MTNQQHLITPPPELVQEWIDNDDFPSSTGTFGGIVSITKDRLCSIATQAARWGADQELEACINYFYEYDTSWSEDSDLIAGLRADRRPKPPNKKQRGLTALEATNLKKDNPLLYQEILNAIEGLPND